MTMTLRGVCAVCCVVAHEATTSATRKMPMARMNCRCESFMTFSLVN